MQNFGFTEVDWKFIDRKEKVSVIRWTTSIYQVYCGGRQAFIRYIAEEDKLEKILENPQVIKTLVVRNGKRSTLGYQSEVWKGWN